MSLLGKVIVKNFRCFRNEVIFNLNTSTYLIGTNNSGKSTLLKAIRCFFNEELFVRTDVNSTELASRKTGYNKSEISIVINTEAIQTVTRQRQIKSLYGKKSEITIKKVFTYKEASDTIERQIFIENKSIKLEKLTRAENVVMDILSAVTVSYIHPQEGIALLENAQEKFKSRLFQNWGRHASVSNHIKNVDKEWSILRETANNYLSSALTQRLQKIWPDSEISINLPETIQDVVAIADISFKSSPLLPEITLSEQGTGVQSTVLYQTHYILDSDKSLHKGQYYPIWLLEEPESFLHADIAIQLGSLLNSDEWLTDIQMIISSHSPLILATSQNNQQLTNWIALENHMIKKTIKVADIDIEILENIGQLLGDPNFPVYFEISNKSNQIYIEDSKPITKEKYIEAGIEVTKALNGTPEIKQLLTLTTSIPELVQKSIIFIIDADKGIKDFKAYLTMEINETNGFKLFKVKNNSYIITLPEDTAVEHMFTEFDALLLESIQSVYNEDLTLKETDIDFNFARYIGKNKGKKNPETLDEAKSWMQNGQEIKDLLWKKVSEQDLQFSHEATESLKALVLEVQSLN